MPLLVIAAGGKNANIRERDGRLTRAMMSRFVGQVIVGGKKGEEPSESKKQETFMWEDWFVSVVFYC